MRVTRARRRSIAALGTLIAGASTTPAMAQEIRLTGPLAGSSGPTRNRLFFDAGDYVSTSRFVGLLQLGLVQAHAGTFVGLARVAPKTATYGSHAGVVDLAFVSARDDAFAGALLVSTWRARSEHFVGLVELAPFASTRRFDGVAQVGLFNDVASMDDGSCPYVALAQLGGLNRDACMVAALRLGLYNASSATFHGGLDLGVVNRTQRFEGVAEVGVVNVGRDAARDVVTLSLANLGARDFAGVAELGVFTWNARSFEGVVEAGVVNLAGSNWSGVVQIGVLNEVGDATSRALFSGRREIDFRQERDFSFHGLLQLGVGNALDSSFYGVAEIALGINHARDDFRGLVQIAGVVDWTERDAFGLGLVAPLNVVGRDFSGLAMAGAVNVATSVHGAQIGLVNVARELHGVQLGVVNVGGPRALAAVLPVVNVGL
jgi:hypothetical protein